MPTPTPAGLTGLPEGHTTLVALPQGLPLHLPSLERMAILERLLRKHTWFTEGSTQGSFRNSGTLGDGWLERYDLDAVVHELNCNWIEGLKDFPSARHWQDYGAKLGAGAIPKILDALAVADKRETASYIEILTQLIDNKTFPILAEGLAENLAAQVVGLASGYSHILFPATASGKNAAPRVAARRNSQSPGRTTGTSAT